MRAVQYITDEYLEHCKTLTLDQRLQFLEDFKKLQSKKSPSKLISMKVPENLLDAFKRKCDLHNVKYQTQIKELMRDWLSQL